jgi:hypothetical protein
MAERRGIPIEISKSLLEGLVFLPRPNGVRRAKLIAITRPLISASDPPKSMIRSFALSGAGGRVFMPGPPVFFGVVDGGVATAYFERLRAAKFDVKDDWPKLFSTTL